tara:strand:- start:8587 stop:8997 length:411 start_codon:yes stop_codon:yes gene_type:complete
MADAVTSQTLIDGPKTTVMAFTNLSDGSGESAVAKVDASALAALSGPGASTVSTDIRINQVWAMVDGMNVDVLWNASSNVLAFSLSSATPAHLDFRSFGGLQNNAGSGVNGDILFTTRNHTSGDTYSIILELIKKT